MMSDQAEHSRTDDKTQRILSCLALGKAYSRQGNPEQAFSCLRKALNLAETIKNKPLSLECHQTLAQFHKEQDDFEKALNHYEQFHTLKETVLKEQAEARAEQLLILNDITQTVTSTLDFQVMLNFVTRELVKFFKADSCRVALLNVDRTEMTIVAEHILRSEISSTVGMVLSLEENPFSVQIIETGKPGILSKENPDLMAQYSQDTAKWDLQGVMILPLLARGKVIGTIELGTHRPDRAFSTAEIRLAETIAGQIAGAVANARLYSQTQKALAAARIANRAKDDFLANMSHELRTPLNGILGYAQILKQERSLSEQQKRDLNIIQQSGEYLLTLINDILDLSKIEAGKMDLSLTDFHLPTFLKNLTDIIRIQADMKGLAFIYMPFDFVEDRPRQRLPTGVRGDEKRLRQILINLLGNAIKFTEKGQVIFKVGPIKENSPTEKNIRFQVEDTGIGIANHQIEAIFKPFQQVGERKFQLQGTGLGLAISRSMIELMGSRLEVESTLDQGSKFWFDITLPLVPQPMVPEEINSQPLIIGFRGEAKKILIVDDRAENRRVLVGFLEPLGFEIETAQDGQEALDKALHLQPDLIITDLVMPVMDGFELTRRIRRIPSLAEIKVFAVSASVYKQDKEASFSAGCNVFIPKPIQREAILAELKKHLQLNWIYEKNKAEIKKSHHKEFIHISSTEEFPAPSYDLIKMFLDLALMGDIETINEEIAKLEDTDQQFGSFTATLRQLAQSFQMDGICKFLETYLK